MTVPVVIVNTDVFDSNGVALAGATFKAKITGYDVYQDQVVERSEISATSDALGHVQLSLFPNTLGEQLDPLGNHTAYVFKIFDPTGRKIYQTTARVPNNDCELTDIAGNLNVLPITTPPVAESIGIVVKIGETTYQVRLLQVDSSGGLSVTNPAGTAGNPVISLTGDLAALEALATAGIAVRTGASTWALRSMQAPAEGLTITNPAGIAGNPIFALANDLAALEALAGPGFAVRTAADAWAVRTFVAPAAGITITNPAGTAGNPTLVLADDLAAVEGLATTGIAVRTAASTWVSRTLTAPAAGITITNPAGLAGDPTLVLANDLAALEALATTGQAVRTAGDTWELLAAGTEGQGVRADSTQSTGLIFTDYYDKPNLQLNPNNLLDQINEGALYTVTAALNVRTVDGWSGDATGAGTFKVRRVVDPDNAAFFAIEVTCTVADAAIAAADLYEVWTGVEGYDAAAFQFGLASGVPFTWQFGLKSNVTGTYGVYFSNSAGNRFYAGTITVADTAAHEYSVKVTPDAAGTWLYTNGLGLRMGLVLAGGSNFQGAAGAWGAGTVKTVAAQANFMSVNTNIMFIKRGQFIPGSIVQAYKPADVQKELARAQRHQTKSYDQGVAVGTNTTVGAHFSGSFTANGGPFALLPFKVTMRAAPTMAGYAPDGTVNKWRDGSAANQNVTIDLIGVGSARAFVSAGDQTSGIGHYTAIARIF